MDTIEVTKGQDFAVEYRIRAGDGHGQPIRVTLTADAALGSTSLNIKPDHPAFAIGDKLLYGQDVVITLSATCDAGDPTMEVTATLHPLETGAQLEKLVDLTAYNLKAVVLEKRGDVAADALIPDTAFTVTLATQSGVDRGKVMVSALAAATASKAAGSYYGSFWRRDSGNTRPLAEFTFKLVEAGEDGFA